MAKKCKYNSIDLFAGCGGLSQGMVEAGFIVRAAVEIDSFASSAFRLNHPQTEVFEDDIRNIESKNIKKIIGKNPIHLLAGCPPCQGFSSLRRLNRKRSVNDSRNSLVLEFLRMVKELQPQTIMMENVPGLENYYQFIKVFKELKNLGYNPKKEVVDVKDYGVPQSRKRLVVIGSRIGNIDIVVPSGLRTTVRDAIGNIEAVETTQDPVHKIYPSHTPKIQELIKLVPKNGGGRKDLPEEYILECHKKEGVGFNDVYGRLRWDDFSTTITGGCLNPSKGRFLHPEHNRCISAREAALLQSFPKDYKFPTNIPKQSLALLIGNALPPKFSYIQSNNIKEHLDKYL